MDLFEKNRAIVIGADGKYILIADRVGNLCYVRGTCELKREECSETALNMQILKMQRENRI